MGTVGVPSSRENVAGRVLYGMVFMVAVPIALVFWTRGTADVIHTPVFLGPLSGLAIAALGVVTVLIGMFALWRRGGGLPMNAFPPPRFVVSGIYVVVPHPIYGGFVMACGGVAIFAGSASGLWLITPAVALACSALVLGYEMPDLRRRFGPPPSSLWLPADRETPPSWMERIRVYFTLILPWCVVFELIGYLGVAPDAVATYSHMERTWPVFAWTEPIYFSIYLAVLLFPMLTGSGRALRRFALMGYTAMAVIFPLYLLLPFYVPPRPFLSTSLFGSWLQLERSSVSGVAASPSFHVVWTCIVASAIGEDFGWKKLIAWVWVLLVAASCVTTGMHSIADVLAGLAAFIVIRNMPAIWRWILRAAEQVANSWREWRIGPVRIINHGAYAGAGAAVGILIIDSLMGPGKAAVSLAMCIGVLVGAALWAQWVEGSPALLRPLGFYGGVLGSMAGAMVAFALHLSFWTALAAMALAGPWIQALGRLRCLVQGCCHGHPTQSATGIRYVHPRSRVCRIAHFDGIPVHATPVYSILWNVLIGTFLFRLFQLHTSAAFICGVYFILSGPGRFVEEAYRGEPQTRIVAGLRFYQWISIVFLIAGAALTCLRSTLPLPVHPLRLSSVALAIGCGLLTWFVSGVDFPESSRRFARLT